MCLSSQNYRENLLTYSTMACLIWETDLNDLICDGRRLFVLSTSIYKNLCDKLVLKETTDYST